MSEEITSFITELRADRQAAKDKEKRESWTKYTSLSIVFIAILTAYASNKAGGCSSRVMKDLNAATFNQSNASDQWSFFQAKAVKGAIAELELEQAKEPAVAEKLKAKIARYDKEREEIKSKAEKFEKDRDAANEDAKAMGQLGGKFGMAVSIYQISIAVGSICLVMKRKSLWYVSLALAAAATLQLVLALLS
jgi:hypothetical protein